MSKILIITALLFSLNACSGNNQQGKEQNNIQTKPTNVSADKEMSLTNNNIAKRAKKKIAKYNEINQVIAIHNDMELIVGFNVKKLQEFNVKNIEKRVNKDLKKEFPTEQIFVSHDRKILMELEKLINEQEHLSEKEINQRMEQIKSLSKELTLL